MSDLAGCTEGAEAVGGEAYDGNEGAQAKVVGGAPAELLPRQPEQAYLEQGREPTWRDNRSVASSLLAPRSNRLEYTFTNVKRMEPPLPVPCICRPFWRRWTRGTRRRRQRAALLR